MLDGVKPSDAQLADLLARDAAWVPALDEAAAWLRAAAEPDAPAALRHEVRWWAALPAGRAGRWDEVTRLAEDGLGEPYSAREALRLAFLHCLSGSVEEAEHVVSQAVQLQGDQELAVRLATWCEREGLSAAAARLRAGAAGPTRPWGTRPP
jgi:hypothetical protein